MTMAKQLIRLTESDLHKIVKESIRRVLREEGYNSNLDTKQSEIDYDWNYLDNQGQMFDRPFEDNPTPSDIHGLSNDNVLDRRGQLGMDALGVNGSTRKKLARNYNGTPNSYRLK